VNINANAVRTGRPNAASAPPEMGSRPAAIADRFPTPPPPTPWHPWNGHHRPSLGGSSSDAAKIAMGIAKRPQHPRIINLRGGGVKAAAGHSPSPPIRTLQRYNEPTRLSTPFQQPPQRSHAQGIRNGNGEEPILQLTAHSAGQWGSGESPAANWFWRSENNPPW
jgi:hypothetical protein